MKIKSILLLTFCSCSTPWEASEEIKPRLVEDGSSSGPTPESAEVLSDNLIIEWIDGRLLLPTFEKAKLPTPSSYVNYSTGDKPASNYPLLNPLLLNASKGRNHSSMSLYPDKTFTNQKVTTVMKGNYFDVQKMSSKLEQNLLKIGLVPVSRTLPHLYEHEISLEQELIAPHPLYPFEQFLDQIKTLGQYEILSSDDISKLVTPVLSEFTYKPHKGTASDYLLEIGDVEYYETKVTKEWPNHNLPHTTWSAAEKTPITFSPELADTIFFDQDLGQFWKFGVGYVSKEVTQQEYNEIHYPEVTNYCEECGAVRSVTRPNIPNLSPLRRCSTCNQLSNLNYRFLVGHKIINSSPDQNYKDVVFVKVDFMPKAIGLFRICPVPRADSSTNHYAVFEGKSIDRASKDYINTNSQMSSWVYANKKTIVKFPSNKIDLDSINGSALIPTTGDNGEQTFSPSYFNPKMLSHHFPVLNGAVPYRLVDVKTSTIHCAGMVDLNFINALGGELEIKNTQSGPSLDSWPDLATQKKELEYFLIGQIPDLF